MEICFCDKLDKGATGSLMAERRLRTRAACSDFFQSSAYGVLYRICRAHGWRWGNWKARDMGKHSDTTLPLLFCSSSTLHHIHQRERHPIWFPGFLINAPLWWMPQHYSR